MTACADLEGCAQAREQRCVNTHSRHGGSICEHMCRRARAAINPSAGHKTHRQDRQNCPRGNLRSLRARVRPQTSYLYAPTRHACAHARKRTQAHRHASTPQIMHKNCPWSTKDTPNTCRTAGGGGASRSHSSLTAVGHLAPHKRRSAAAHCVPTTRDQAMVERARPMATTHCPRCALSSSHRKKVGSSEVDT